jgi:K+-sensing histidine kinase KdpD
MDSIIKNIRQSIPFPHIDDKKNLHDGIIFKLPIECRNCKRECYKWSDEKTVGTCAKGYNLLKLNLGLFELTIIGLTIQGHQTNIPRKLKKERNQNSISIVEINQWFSNKKSLLKEIDSYKDRMIEEHFSLFHDIIPTISLIFRNLESVVTKYPGQTFDEKVENADNDIRRLYDSIRLLDNRLKLMPLIVNPESAKFGQLQHVSPYKIFDKVRRIFKEVAASKNIVVKLKSNGNISPIPLYDSFITIPFIFIENAIKYSVGGHDISIYLSEDKDGIFISITSYGPIVTNDDKRKIFEKGFKDENAKKFSGKGSGIGLYFANIVAQAHNFEILYDSSDHFTDKSGIIFGKNIFSLSIEHH